jgi:protein tyrosine/serine phosphatase
MNGYKIVIMDFEKSTMNDTEYISELNEKKRIKLFWRNVETFIDNMNVIETKTHLIDINKSDIISCITYMKINNMPAENVIQIIQLIHEMNMSFYKIPDKPVYNSNYFGK